MQMTSISLLIMLLAPLSVYSQESNDFPRQIAQGTPKIIRGPVVVATGYDWANVEWTTNAAGKSSSAVYAGTAVNDLRKVPQTAEPVTRSDLASYQEQQYTHTVRLNYLQPGTVYYFVADPGSGWQTGASQPAQFVTTKRPVLITWGLALSDQ